MHRIVLGLVALCAFAATPARAATIDWIDWTSGSADRLTAGGTLAGGTVTVDYVGSTAYEFLQDGVTGNLTNYWTEPLASDRPYTDNAVVSNAPTGAEGISLNAAGTRTLTFGQAVLNPVIAFNSWNQGGNPGGEPTQGMQFDVPITILSTGRGFWGVGTISLDADGMGFHTVSGEPHGVLQLTGAFTSITFRNLHNENWHGFTLGIEGVAAVPAPAPLLLLVLVAAGLVTGRAARAR